MSLSNMPNIFTYFSKQFFVILFFGANFLSAQNETNNWYFGNGAGLNFGNGDVNVLEDGSMNTPAGCASISDDDGNLLFYTNGSTVWNKNHQIMQNGDGLAGDSSGIQTSIIIPKPNDASTYYIFTTREFDVTSPQIILKGVYYSEIKFTSQNPLGVIVSKNVKIANSSNSRIGAIHHPESNSVRLICMTYSYPDFAGTPNSSQLAFRIFNVNENGVDLNPIVRIINENLEVLGAMKISPNGEYLAVADTINQKIYFYKYDNDNVSFNLYITLPTTPAFGLFVDPYGIEFSQDSKIFYYSGSGYVVQFAFSEMGGPDPVDYYLMNVKNPASIQLGRNGKIYVVQENTNRIAVINAPEKKGIECNLDLEAIRYQNAKNKKGLPIFIASYLRNRIVSIEGECVGQALRFELDIYMQANSVQWDFGDGSFSSDLSPSHVFAIPGNYKVKAKVIMGSKEVTLYKSIEIYPLPQLVSNVVLSQCMVDNTSFPVFNLNNIKDFADDVNSDFTYSFYHSMADANNDNPIQNSEYYTSTLNHEEIFVKIVSSKGCVSFSNFFLDSYQSNTLQINDVFTCENSDGVLNNSEGKFNFDLKAIDVRSQLGIPQNFIIKFYTSLSDAQTKTNPLDRYFIGQITTIWIRIEDQNHNCFGISSFKAVVNSNLGPDIESQYIICDPTVQPAIVIDGGGNNSLWEWKGENGTIVSNQRYFQLTQSGNYSLTVFRMENGLQCSASKNFIVSTVIKPMIGNVKAQNGEIYISVIGNSSYQFSLDGINYYGSGDSYTFTNVTPGIYTVYIKDVNNCEKPINVKVHLIGAPDFFTPNDDGVNDFWKIVDLTEEFYSKVDIQIYDRYGKSLYNMSLDQNKIGWNGTFQNQKLPATDYWYRIILTDINKNEIIKKGHFSLKR